MGCVRGIPSCILKEVLEILTTTTSQATIKSMSLSKFVVCGVLSCEKVSAANERLDRGSVFYPFLSVYFLKLLYN